MDGLTLEKWRAAFEQEVKTIQIEYDAFLLPLKFSDTWELKKDETSGMLSLLLDTENLPEQIQERLSALLLQTEPEDSI